MKPVIIVILLIISATSYSQSNSLTGKIMDAETGKPLYAVTIALLDTAANKTKQTLSGKTGSYSFSAIQPGYYTLLYSFVGYDSIRTASFLIHDTSQAILPTILLHHKTATLEAVTVTSRRPVVETKIDGLIYNAASEPQIAGGNSLDILRKVPLLSLNQDGNVSVAGQSSVKIYIDDKPSEIYGMSAADYLALLPGDRIDRVRVITNPSAKYDADGAAVVLIYTKKHRLKQFTGSMRLVGFLGDYRNNIQGNINLFYKTGMLAFSFGTGYSRSNFRTETILERYATNHSSAVNQHRYDTIARQTPSLNFGIDWEIDSLSSLSFNGTWMEYKYNGYKTQYTQQEYGGVVRNYRRDIDESGSNRLPVVSLAYNKRFKKSEKELSFLGYYSDRNTNSDYTLFQLEQNTINYQELFSNATTNKDLSLQVDYVHPVNKKNKWETGIKTLFRTAISNYDLLPYDAARSGALNYRQDVYAGYGSYETTIGKWQLRTGLRYEHTVTDILFNSNKVSLDPFKNLVPNILLSQNFKNNTILSLNFTQTIQRPNMYYLNPAANYSDSLNISRGNPQLDPPLTNRVETAYTIRMKQASVLRFSLYGSRINNSVVQVRRLLPEGASLTTWENIGRDHRIGFSANWNQTLSKRWKMIAVLNTSWMEQRVSELGLYNNGFWLFSSLYFNYVSKNGFVLDAFIMSQTPSIELQGRWEVIFPQYYFIVISKRFFKDKLGISLRAESFFTPTQPFTTVYTDPAFYQKSITYNSNRLVQINFSYRFNQNVSETKTRAGNKARSVPQD